MLALLRQQWFLVLLLGVLGVGILLPGPIGPVAEAIPRGLVVATVLFLMSVTLPADAMWRAVRQPGPALLAVAINMALAPPLSWLLGHVLPAELAIGLVVAATSPCTLASAAVWTRRAGGNDAVALLVTMITNLTCFATVPLWLNVLIGQTAEVDYSGLMVRLLWLAVLPIFLAQRLRRWQPLAGWVDRHKLSLSIVAQLGLLSIVLQGAVHSGETLAGPAGAETVDLGVGATLLSAVMVLHLILFAVGLFTARRLRMGSADRAAVAIAGSQKTLMIGLDVGMVFAAQFGGLVILPMVAYHALQLIVDTLLADWLRRKSD